MYRRLVRFVPLTPHRLIELIKIERDGETGRGKWFLWRGAARVGVSLVGNRREAQQGARQHRSRWLRTYLPELKGTANQRWQSRLAKQLPSAVKDGW